MEKEFVPYKQALALKELGFNNENCFARWSTYPDGDGYLDISAKSAFQGRDDMNRQCLAPLYQQAFRWFREKYDLQSIIIPFAENSIDENSNTLYYYIINKKQFYGFVNAQEEIGFNSQEEAELKCLKKLIEIAKEQK